MQKQQKPDLRDLVEPARARSKPTGATTAFLPPRLSGTRVPRSRALGTRTRVQITDSHYLCIY